MVFILYLYGVYMVFTSEEERIKNEGNTRHKEFFYRFFLESLDFCLLLHLEK